jgi:uncharacterized membrane protein
VKVVWGLFIAYCLLVGAWVLARLDGGHNCTYDLGIHDQAVWLVWNGINPLLTSRGLQVQADHFSPMAYALAPIYGLWDSPRALLILQTVWIAAGAFPVYALAVRHLQNKRLAQGMALLYLMQPCMLFMNLFDFHFSALMTTPLLWACLALESGESARYYCALLTVMATSETGAMSLLGLVPLAYLKAGWRRALVTLLMAALGMATALAVVRWHNNDQPTQYTNLYADYGGSGREVVVNVLTHPLRTLGKLNTEDNWGYALDMLAPMVFTPLLSPLQIVPAAPVIAGNLLSWRDSQHSIHFHYQAGVLPFLMWACIVAFAKLEKRYGWWLCSRLLAVGCLLGFLFGPMMPDEWEPDTSTHARAQRELQTLIPPDASTSVENTLGGLFSHRARGYLFPNPVQSAAWGSRRQALIDQTALGLDPASPGTWRRSLERGPVDYIVAEPGAWHDFPMLKPDRDYFLSEICAVPGYRLVYNRNGVVAFQKNGAGPRYGPRVLQRADYSDWKAHLNLPW